MIGSGAKSLVGAPGWGRLSLERLIAMNTFVKITGALLALVMVGAFIINVPAIQAQLADSQRGPVPVIVNPAPKQYRVIDISRLPTYISTNLTGNIENGLNDLGKQGWTLVAVSGSYLIMMR